MSYNRKEGNIHVGEWLSCTEHLLECLWCEKHMEMHRVGHGFHLKKILNAYFCARIAQWRAGESSMAEGLKRQCWAGCGVGKEECWSSSKWKVWKSKVSRCGRGGEPSERGRAELRPEHIWRSSTSWGWRERRVLGAREQCHPIQGIGCGVVLLLFLL